MNSQNQSEKFDVNKDFWLAINEFVRHVDGMLTERWRKWATTHEDRDLHEVIGGILSRQVSLTSQLALNIGMWNYEVAPLMLRPMVEGLITLAWILEDPQDKPRKFMLYGLGQDKLLLEHEKEQLRQRGVDPDQDQTIVKWESWLNAERLTELTEVNVGEWAGMNLRQMAEQAHCLDLHKIDYARWSGATHGMWQHLVKFNLRHCKNPLHGFHRVPLNQQPSPDPGYLQWASEYVDLSFNIFDEKVGIHIDGPSATEMLEHGLEKVRVPTDMKKDNLVDPT